MERKEWFNETWLNFPWYYSSTCHFLCPNLTPDLLRSALWTIGDRAASTHPQEAQQLLWVVEQKNHNALCLKGVKADWPGNAESVCKVWREGPFIETFHSWAESQGTRHVCHLPGNKPLRNQSLRTYRIEWLEKIPKPSIFLWPLYHSLLGNDFLSDGPLSSVSSCIFPLGS